MKVPDFTPEKWSKWLKDKEYAEERVDHLEEELDKALDEQERLSHANEELKVECEAEKRSRVQAESDARRAKAAADQAAAAAAAASRSLKLGEKQASGGGGKDGAEVQELRVEMQQLKAKNHGLNTQMDALAVDHERLAGLLSTAQNDLKAARAEADELRTGVASLEQYKATVGVKMQEKEDQWETLVVERDAAKAEANRLGAENTKLGDELDRMAGNSSGKKGYKSGASTAELEAANKSRDEAEKRLAACEVQLAELQTELRSSREEVASLQDAAEMKSGAMREALAAADQETGTLRAELSALKESKEPSVVGEADKIATLRAQLGEMKTAKEAAEEKVVELKSHLEVAAEELSGMERSSSNWREKSRVLEKQLSNGSVEQDEEGTQQQLLEMMSLLRNAEAAKEEVEEKLASKNKEVEELRAGKPRAAANGSRSLGHELEGGNADARVAALQEELEDLHGMLDNIASERDTALNDLRRAGGGGAGDDEDEEEKAAALATAREEATTAKEEVARLAQECDDLRKEVTELQDEQAEGIDPNDKRVRVLEEQVERLSQEHTRQSETWRGLSSQLESEKEELSQELISAKLQVAQLSMEVDGLKLRHRQATIAAAQEHAEALQQAISPAGSHVSTLSHSSGSSGRSHPPPSPPSPHTPAHSDEEDFASSPHTLEL